MSPNDRHSPMRIRLSEERRTRILEEIRLFFDEEMDREISSFQAERLLDLFIKKLGPAVYNQAIQDARGFMMDKLEDLEGEFFEPVDD